MNFIAHRGAVSFATENTLEAIQKAIDIGAQAIEIDVWTSKDGVPIVHHDSSLVRVTGTKLQIFKTSSKEIAKIRTFSGEKIPTLEQAIKTANNVPLIIDVNDYYLSKGLVDILNKYKHKDISVCSSRFNVLLELKKQMPDLKIYASTNYHPFRTLKFIRAKKLYGISLNYHAFSLLVYFLCRKHKVDILLFTVDNDHTIKLLRLGNIKNIGIITNYPEKFLNK